ncbi:hypothetical protein RFI_31994 [Reticulomyxa filosa]|uniref:Uncharacterized protein n=1 Tax=Reticulomyxa filosa TaxID=46433 RepID=X6LVN5_RETFI|nr:hypothetical protein RFI_31994 [Reticulomyxa filosa]|eukprot:ETO05401.1 hypothetical protein RFI_31994 [Reticulomyxa filosa]
MYEQEIQILKGHSNAVTRAQFSSDGYAIVSCSDNTIRLGNVKSGQEFNKMEVITGNIAKAQFSPDCYTIDLVSGREIQKLGGHANAIKSLQFSKDGDTIVSSSWEEIVSARMIDQLRFFWKRIQFCWRFFLLALEKGTDDYPKFIFILNLCKHIHKKTQLFKKKKKRKLIDIFDFENQVKNFDYFDSSMKFSLILATMHVLNALLVVSSANTFNSSKSVTKEQTYSNHHNNRGMLAASLNKLISYYINYVWISKACKCAQYPQSYKLAILSLVGIFNKESMVLENESIRFTSSTMLINCEKIAHIKKRAMNMLQSTSGTSPTFLKFKFDAISYRSNKQKKKIMSIKKKKKMFITKKFAH